MKKKRIGTAIRCGKGKEFYDKCKKKDALKDINLTAETFCDMCPDRETYNVYF